MFAKSKIRFYGNRLMIVILKHFLQPFRCSPLVAVKVECIEGVLRADRERHLKIFWLDNKFPYPSALGYRDVNLGVGMQVRSRTEHRPQTWRGGNIVGRDLLPLSELLSITHPCVSILSMRSDK